MASPDLAVLGAKHECAPPLLLRVRVRARVRVRVRVKG